MDRKISTITVDNCSSNDSMIDILREKLSLNNSLLLNGKFFHMRCAARILNLVVKEGLDVIRVEIEKIHDSVAFWSATPSRVEKFEDMQLVNYGFHVIRNYVLIVKHDGIPHT